MQAEAAGASPASSSTDSKQLQGQPSDGPGNEQLNQSASMAAAVAAAIQHAAAVAGPSSSGVFKAGPIANPWACTTCLGC